MAFVRSSSNSSVYIPITSKQSIFILRHNIRSRLDLLSTLDENERKRFHGKCFLWSRMALKRTGNGRLNIILRVNHAHTACCGLVKWMSDEVSYCLGWGMKIKLNCRIFPREEALSKNTSSASWKDDMRRVEEMDAPSFKLPKELFFNNDAIDMNDILTKNGRKTLRKWRDVIEVAIWCSKKYD